MSSKISFIPSSKDVESFLEKPSSAKKEIPSWYKTIKSDYKKNPIFDHEININAKFPGNISNTDVKACMPFFDSMTMGYIQKTWCDIYIKNNGENISYTYASGPQIIGSRDIKSINFFKNEFYPFEFFWKSPWIFKTPQKHSVLILNPLNRADLPFFTLSGIIDSDKFYHTKFGNIPFYIKSGFEGLIPSGTPMYQIIPFKRESWSSKAECYNTDVEKRDFLQRRVFWDFYKKNFWQKKQYE